MGLGLVGGYGAAAAQEALVRLKAEKAEQEALAQQARQREFENSLKVSAEGRATAGEGRADEQFRRITVPTGEQNLSQSAGRYGNEMTKFGDDQAALGEKRTALSDLKRINPTGYNAAVSEQPEDLFLNDEQRDQRALATGRRKTLGDHLSFIGTDEPVAGVMPTFGGKLAQESELDTMRTDNAIRQSNATYRAPVSPFASMSTQFSSQRPDPATANVTDRSTGLTPNSIYQDGMFYAVSGSLPPGSRAMAAMPAQLAVRNTANAMMAAAGVNPAELRAEYAGAKASTRKLMDRYQFNSSAAQAAMDNLRQAETLGQQVARTGVPIVNRYEQYVTSMIGGTSLPGLSAYEAALYSGVREYAKVATGSAGSVAGLTDAATAEVERLLNASQTPAQFSAVIDFIEMDMENSLRPMRQQIAGASDVGPSMKQFMEFVSGKPLTTAAPGALAPGEKLAADGVSVLVKNASGAWVKIR